MCFIRMERRLIPLRRPGIQVKFRFGVIFPSLSEQTKASNDIAKLQNESGASFSMPVSYGNYLVDLGSQSNVGWNCFYRYLQRQSEFARNPVSGEFQFPWVCRVLPGYAMVDRPRRLFFEKRPFYKGCGPRVGVLI